MRGILTPHGGDGSSHHIPYSVNITAGSDPLKRTFVAGNRKKYILSGWFKAYDANSNDTIFSTSGGSDMTHIDLEIFSNKLRVKMHTATIKTHPETLVSNVWYHCILSIDTSQATANERVELILNGTYDDDVGNAPALHADTGIGRAATHYFGTDTTTATLDWEGNLAEWIFLNGVSIQSGDHPVSAFYNYGSVDVSGLYNSGTNEFFLSFGDSEDLGRDMGTDGLGGNDWVHNSNVSHSNDSPTQSYIAMSGNAASEDWNGHSFRHHWTPSPGDWSYIRFKYVGNVSHTMDIDKVSVGIKSTSGNAYDTMATPVEVMFGGTSGISIGNEEIWSDWVALEILDGDDVTMVADIGVTATRVDNSTGTLDPSLVGYYRAGTSSFNQSTPSGLWTSVGNQGRGFPRVIQVADRIPDEFEIITTLRKVDLNANANTNREGNSLRQVMTLGGPSGKTYTEFRVRQEPNNAYSYDLDNVAIGLRDGATGNSVSTPVEILEGGTSGMELPANTPKDSDWTTFTAGQGDDILVIHDVTSDGDQRARWRSGGGDDTYESKADANGYDVATAPDSYHYSSNTFSCSRIEGKRMSDSQD